MKIRTVTLSKWDHIHKFNRPGWLFRGQREVKWDLKTSLERCCDYHGFQGSKRHELEANLLREFRRTYHLYAQHIPDKESVAEWLSVMQHHGAPTRLLDFTYSVYVAAYFATESTGGTSAVWAIDGPSILKRAARLLRGSQKSGVELDRMEKVVPFEESHQRDAPNLFFVKPFVRAVWPINAYHLNERQIIQRGVFVICGDPASTFMENILALQRIGSAKWLIKIIIPPRVAREAIRALFSMGISRTSLFPGLDGFAQSLAVWHSSFDPPDWNRKTM